MTDEQMTELRQHFETIDQRFDAIDQRFDTVDRRLAAMDQRFDAMDQRFGAMDQRFGVMDQRFGAMDQRFGAMDQRFDKLDREVHRLGVQLESNSHEVKLAIENFQGLQRITNAKIEELRERVDQRIAPLELAVRAHTAELAEHARRLDERDR
jgi:hypothetical protein